MSSYPPPQPGQPYPQGGGYAYQPPPPPQKNNTVWWVLGGLAALLVLCCCAGVIWVGWFANEVGKGVSSAVSSYSTTGSVGAASATSVSEGGSVTLGDAEVRSGWSVDSSGKVVGMSVRNGSTTSDSYYIKVYYMKDGSYLTDVSCTTGLIQPGDSATATCYTPVTDVSDRTEIRMSEGF